MSDIVTNYWMKPISTSKFDWQAYRDPEGKIGHGTTEQEAIDDLLEQESEA